MLSEEEQNAVEFFKECITKGHLFEEDFTLYNMKILVNLITKLQKENETTIKLNVNMSKRHFNDNLKIKNYEKQIDSMAEWIEKHTKYYDEDGCYCEVEKEICEKDIENVKIV